VVIPLSEKIKSFKKIDTAIDNNNSDLDSNPSSSSDPTVLGASTWPEDTKKDNTSKSAFNIALDGLSFLVKNWLWTLGGIFVIFFFMRSKKKK
jgi:hypothetical protein